MSFLRNMSFGRVAAVVAAIVFGTINTAKADILIDDFSLPTPFVQTFLNGTTTTGSVVTSLPGSVRTISYTLLNPSASSSVVGTVSDNGVLNVDVGTTTGATINASYAFSSTQNFIPNVPAGGMIGDLMFSGFSQTAIGGAATTYTLTVNTTTGDLSTSGSLNATLTTQLLSLSSLTGTGDLAAVSGISLTLNAGRAADLQIDQLSVTTPPAPNNAIPAPPAVLLALAAIPVLGLRRKMLAKKA
jgi:hypothetical protein